MLKPNEACRLVQKCIPRMRSTTTHNNNNNNNSDDDCFGTTRQHTTAGGEGMMVVEQQQQQKKKPPIIGLEDIIRPCDISIKSIARLWAGMGHVYCLSFSNGTTSSSSSSKGKNKEEEDQCNIIVKLVSPTPTKTNLNIGDRRKADSYQVEASFYENYASTLINEHNLTIPIPYYVERGDHGKVIICMSRLVDDRKDSASAAAAAGHDDDIEASKATLLWLATLHAATWGEETANSMVTPATTTSEGKGGLQPIGSYWHLDTRPDEHEKMSRRGWEGRLYFAARAISDRLKRDPMQCIIHGDAKDANIVWYRTTTHKDDEIKKKKYGNDDDDDDSSCHQDTTLTVGMYDFQYCGKAPPTVDLAYYLCVAVADNDNKTKDTLLEYYHNALTKRLAIITCPNEKKILPTITELKESLSLAYCDFARFMCGWGWWGDDASSEVIEVLDRLDGGKNLGSEIAYDAAVRREFG